MSRVIGNMTPEHRRIQDEIAAYATTAGGTVEDLDHHLQTAASEALYALYADEAKD